MLTIDASGLDVLHIVKGSCFTLTKFPNGKTKIVWDTFKDDMISVKIIKDSITNQQYRIITFELEYPRFIHAELMTHRQFSRNAASSRAVPIANMIKHVKDNPAFPVHWGKNQPGMQAAQEIDTDALAVSKHTWMSACASACEWSALLNSQGLHKQIVNRVTEPFQVMKTIVTATEYKNWFWLRCHADAQPEIKQLADKMRILMLNSNPQLLNIGDWHLPYVNCKFGVINQDFYDADGTLLTLTDAKKVSASCCAQVSYRRYDDSLARALAIYDRLIISEPAHASPVEHQATPIPDINRFWPDGVTHMDLNGEYWSGNFRGWIQNRKLLGL